LIKKLINTSTQLLVHVLQEFLHFFMLYTYAANGKILLLELVSWEPLENSLR